SWISVSSPVSSSVCVSTCRSSSFQYCFDTQADCSIASWWAPAQMRNHGIAACPDVRRVRELHSSCSSAALATWFGSLSLPAVVFTALAVENKAETAEAPALRTAERVFERNSFERLR